MPHFYEKPASPSTPSAAQVASVWRALAAAGTDPFDGRGEAWAAVAAAAAEGPAPPTAAGLPELGGAGDWPARYWPLEWFRADGPPVPGGLGGRHFLSSGTTSATRSRSPFSPAGLALYRELSVFTFRHVLAQVLPAAAASAPAARGFSLVPPVEAWPDSSLAQMVAWIGAELPVTYVDELTLAPALAGAAAPVWLFGTAFHLVTLLDHGRACRLPPGSVVVETGGTKGRAREVSRAEFYAAIAAGFGIAEAAIISEYGMCELASQAYDFVARGDGSALAARRFRFPAWVRAAALTGPGRMAPSGRGALLVDDPLRLDVPWPLRTEDLADVAPDGFALLGRAPLAPLKGCSLAAEEAASGATSQDPSTPPSAEHGPRRPGATLALRAADAAARSAEERAPALARCLAAFMEADESAELLAAELGSPAAAKAALADLGRGLPPTTQAWTAAVRTAVATSGCPARWLFILPDNHSLVGFYPLALAYAAGLAVTVRLPARFARSDNLLGAFLAALATLPGADLDVCGPELRLPTAPGSGSLAAAAFGGVLCYGATATVAALSAHAGVPVKGFGNRYGVSLVAEAALEASASALAQDALGLAQRGCMSTRVVLLSGAGAMPAATLAACLADAGRRFWQAPLPWASAVGLDWEALRLERAGFAVFRPAAPGAPLVAVRDVGEADASAINDTMFIDALARAPFTIPVLRWPGTDVRTFVKVMRARPDPHGELGTVTAAGETAALLRTALARFNYRGLSFRALGAANAPRWDGLHEGRAVFAFDEPRSRSHS